MSRLAKKQIPIASGVTIEEKGEVIVVKGTKGERRIPMLPKTRVALENNAIQVTVEESGTQSRANQGTMWALIRNAVEGVTSGFSKVLEIEGIGYRVAMEGKTLVLHLGYAHPVRVETPHGITIEVEKNTVKISGIDKDLVGRTAAKIRALKKPEPYKGKGIRYQGEVVKIKAGKKATTSVAG